MVNIARSLELGNLQICTNTHSCQLIMPVKRFAYSKPIITTSLCLCVYFCVCMLYAKQKTPHSIMRENI